MLERLKNHLKITIKYIFKVGIEAILESFSKFF